MNQDKKLHTLPLFSDTDQVSTDLLSCEPTHLWAFALSGYDWLQFLADEWWPILPIDAPIILGNGSPVSSSSAASSIEVIAWLDPLKLPSEKVSVFRDNRWSLAAADELKVEDAQFAWHGPIPLFAVSVFSVKTDERRVHLTGLAKSFSNIDLPPVDVRADSFDLLIFDEKSPTLVNRMRPPHNWDSLRGAAAMALWSVPAIAPWLDALCMLLSKPEKPTRAKKKPDLDIPWLSDTPWRYLELKRASNATEPSVILWRAMLDIFAITDIKQDWRPQIVLEQICDRAMQKGMPAGSLDALLLETSELLDDRNVVNGSRGAHDPVGLTLQLILLRPEPEKFMSWRTDLQLSPAIIWMGAIISGLLTGYRNLERRFKGTPERQRTLDLVVWALSFDKPIRWPNAPTPKMVWQLKENHAQIVCDGTILLERSLGQRGQWYEANLNDKKVEAQAIIAAKSYSPELLCQHIKIADTRINLKGSGKASINAAAKQLIIKDEISFSLPSSAIIETKLNHELFRKWVATATLKQRLPALPSNEASPNQQIDPTQNNHLLIDGLIIRNDFLSIQEECELIKSIDSSPWSSDLKRRVQHYGWKYNYQSRNITPSDHLGKLPAWAEKLAQRLFAQGLVPEVPDQVIVNEYLVNQGISKHIDCIDCFKGPIVTISLIESWHMLFRYRLQKIETLLPRRSAVILDGQARYKWTHEIPPRKSENGAPRTRRISLTFRKVKQQVNP